MTDEQATDHKFKDTQELAQSLKHGLFSNRDTVGKAIEYAYQVIESLDGRDRILAFTALHVVLNTIAIELEQMKGRE